MSLNLVVVVLFALLLPLFLLLGVIAVDVGNWYVHKKRLQTLVDAGAFAGATKFVGCSFQFGDPVAANAAIKSTALDFSGDTARERRSRAPDAASAWRCTARSRSLSALL